MDTDDVISIPDSPTRYEAYRRAPPKFVYAKPRVVPVAPFCIGGEKSKELLESMLANQNKMLENQRKMMHMIVETISNVNYISEKVRGTTAAAEASPSSAATATAPPAAAAPTYYSTNFMDPVNSVETLKALEESLQDDSVMQKYVSSMTFICGNNGKANGIDCCYKLVDYFITRQFLLQCSWTGNSRILGPGKSPGDAASDLPQDGESGKVALKFYRKFRTLFLNLIMMADSSFTEMQCEMFFKRIMKNSKQRVMCKMITSKHRNRPSNLKYKIQRPSTSSEPSIEMAAENNEQPFGGEVAPSHSEAASAVEFPQHPYDVHTTATSKAAATRISKPDWSRYSVKVIRQELLTAPSEKTTTNQSQLRCEYCKKKMKKPYKHRNGKCLDLKSKSASRPKCAYCHQTFVSSKGIPGHLRNSCRIYRQVCEAKGIILPEMTHQTDYSSSPAVTPSASVTNETPEPKIASPVQSTPFEQKSKMRRPTKTTKWNTRFSCQYCSKKFTNKSNLIRHQRHLCAILLRTHEEKTLSAVKPPANVAVSVPLPLHEEPSQEDKSAIVKSDQQNLLPEEIVKCDYCQQNVRKKARFLHHNGRCVLGRVNADHQCPSCPEAFASRSLLQKHRCKPALREEQTEQNNVDATAPSEPQPPERKQRRITKPTPKQLAREKTPVMDSSRKRRPKVIDVSPKSIVKREFCTYCRQRIKESERQKHAEKRCFNNNETTYNCGYCRKGFAARDSLIEHQRVCTVRKNHKQVKCQFCGAMISNRGNLRKHQKVYCKSVKRADGVKPEKPEKSDKPEKLQKPEKPEKVPKPEKGDKVKKPEKPDKPKKPLVVKEEKPIKKKKRVKRELQEEDEENIPLKQRKIKSKSNAGSTEGKAKKKRPTKTHGAFPCEYCGRTFQTERGARKHESKCSTKPSIKSFKCKYCSERFSSKSNLYRHHRTMCSKVNPQKDVVNETILEFAQPKTTEAASSTTVEEKKNRKRPDPIKIPRSDPDPAPCPEQSRTESVPTPMSTNDDGDKKEEIEVDEHGDVEVGVDGHGDEDVEDDSHAEAEVEHDGHGEAEVEHGSHKNGDVEDEGDAEVGDDVDEEVEDEVDEEVGDDIDEEVGDDIDEEVGNDGDAEVGNDGDAEVGDDIDEEVEDHGDREADVDTDQEVEVDGDREVEVDGDKEVEVDGDKEVKVDGDKKVEDDSDREVGDDSDDDDVDGDDDGMEVDEPVPEPEEEEEIIVTEEHLPMVKEEVVVAVDAHHDHPHQESDNNNAELDKGPTEAMRLPIAAPVIERREDSQHVEQQQPLPTAAAIVPDCESERETMQVEHSAN